MLRSMTGFGTATCDAGGVRIEAEARSVNHRGLLVKLRLPSEFSALEPELEALVRARFARGSIQLSLGLREDLSGARAARVDDAVLRAYIEAARSAAHAAGMAEPRDIAPFFTLPGVAGSRPLSAEELELRSATLHRAAAAAIEALAASRAREGRALQVDLEQRAAEITVCVERISARAPHVIEAWRERLARRMRELFGDAPGAPRDEDLLREAALFAERSDIAEELTRLAAHRAHLSELLAEEDAVGRKLDFLLQEMNREANTIGSKASDLEIAREVVSLRTAVDRLKEQVQNVE